MSVTEDVRALRGWATILGKRVYRDPTILGKTADTPYALFDVAGGLVLVTSIIGEVETGPLEDVGSTIRLSANPDAGAAVHLDSGALVVQADAVGTMYYLPDVNTSPLLAAFAVVGVATSTPRLREFVTSTGSIDLTVATQDSEEGTVSWTLHYIPIDQYASVVPA